MFSLSFRILLFLLLGSNTILFGQATDEQEAERYLKKFPDEGVVCLSSYRYFTFDKGSNSFGDKVVEIQEDGEYEFLSLKKYATLTYSEFYNQFIRLNTFKKAYKLTSKKYYTMETGGYDRSVTDDNIFFDDSRVRYFPMRFTNKATMQRVTVRKTYTDGKYLTKLFFHAGYPIREQVIEFKVPEWMSVDFIKMNFEQHTVEIKESKKGGYTNYVFIMRDLPAYKSEYHRIGRSYTDPHIIVQIKSYESKGEQIKGFEKVDDVYNWNNRLYLKAGNDRTKLKDQLARITQGKTTDLDKIKAIYYWVQDNIRYIAYEDGYSGYIPAAAQEVLSKKYGDCKGMANLLTEFLNMAGYQAYFTWIGTRHIPYAQSLPALCVNNHAICTLVYDGKTYYLDGTENYVPFGENAFRIQGKEVMIAKGSQFEIKAVPRATAPDNRVYTKADLVLVNDKLSGRVKVELTGNQRTEFHQSFQNLPLGKQQEYLDDYLSFSNSNMVAANVKTSDLKNRELPVKIEGDVDLSNTVNNISNDKYVSIDFFPKSLEKFVPDAKRVEGYDLDLVIRFEDEIALSIPADKKFIDKPDNLELKFDGYEFKGTYTIEGSRLVLKKELTVRNSIIPKKEFSDWTKFIASIREFNKYLVTISNK